VSELGKRVAVAAVGIPVVLALAWLGGWFLAVPLAAVGAWAAHECYRFAHRKQIRPIEAIGSTISALFVLIAAWRPSFPELAPWSLGVLAAATILAMLTAMMRRGPEGHPLAAASITVGGATYVGLMLGFAPLLHALPTAVGWVSATEAREAGLIALALPLAATWIGDAAAYFAGSAWGRTRRKLAPSISPNKSWVGFWAGVAGASVAAVLWHLVASARMSALDVGGLGAMVVVGALLGVSAVLGDLVESLLKREAGVKDSGTFFPGHGGVMDRIDSLLFTIPSAYLLLSVLSRWS
jgi:phosphatidate cytidylyltransferase